MPDKSVRLTDLTRFMNDTQVHFGIPRENAQLITDAVLDGELRGHPDHGIFFFPYVFLNHEGANLNRQPSISVIDRSNLSVKIDGDNGYGVIAMSRVTDEVIDIARTNGMAIGFANNSHNLVALAPFVQRAVDQGLIALAGSGARLTIMPPTGGLGGAFSTNPMAFGAPAGKHHPYLFDAAMSAIAGAKVLEAAQTGELLQPGLVEDLDGNPITDATGKSLRDVLLLPMSGVKGFGFAMMVDIMATVLSGEDTFGHWIWVLDPEQSMPLTEFNERMDAEIDRIKSVKRKPGVDEIFYPGEKGQRRMAQIKQAGQLELNDAAWSALESVAKRFDIEAPESIPSNS